MLFSLIPHKIGASGHIRTPLWKKEPMSDTAFPPPPRVTGEIRSTLRELQNDSIPLVLAGSFAAGIILLIWSMRLPDPAVGGTLAMILFASSLVVLCVHERHFSPSVWLLAVTCLIVDLLAVLWGGADVAVCLLALPIGLLTMFVGGMEGSLAGVLVTIILLIVPLGPSGSLQMRVVAMMGVWGMVGLILLTQRPFSTAVQWSWSSYERSRNLLEQARDSQVRLKETLADLAEANLQLTRLDRTVQGLRQAAEEARRAKEEFVANVSHELRTPLNMIIGFTELIVQTPHVYGSRIPQNLLADLDVILRNSQHLSRLIDDVLDLSQVETGQVVLVKERVLLHEVIAAAVTAVHPLFASKGLSLEMDVPQDLPGILCDPTRIRQVVLNLLSNAGRFTERGGVRIRAWQEGGSIMVSVADTGPGISPDAVSKVFEPFQQLDASIRRRYGGSGLGLSISKRFIELHQGQIWLESEEGRGTTFFFSLPIDPPTPVESRPSRWINPYLQYEERIRPSRVSAPVLRPRFVVSESGDVLQRLLSRYVGNAEVAATEDLQQALQEALHTPARALLINDVSVGEALGRLDEAGGPANGTPVIICSVPGIHEVAVGMGATDYLVKPVLREALLAAMDRLPMRGKTVLIVDDEPQALRLFRRMLLSSERGYRILTASDGQSALEVLHEQPADVILLDLVMSGMDGFQFLAVKRQDPALQDIPTILISARDAARQPIVSNALAVTKQGGLSLGQMLACIEAISGIMAPPGQAGDLEWRAEPAG